MTTRIDVIERFVGDKLYRIFFNDKPVMGVVVGDTQNGQKSVTIRKCYSDGTWCDVTGFQWFVNRNDNLSECIELALTKAVELEAQFRGISFD